MAEDYSAAFDKLAALKRRYQQESDPVPDLDRPLQDEADDFDGEDIPVLTQAVLILDEAPVEAIAVEAIEVDAPEEAAAADTAILVEAEAARVLSAEDLLFEKLIERLRPELELVIQQTVQSVLEGKGSGLYEAWLAGLRRRTRHLMDDGEQNTSSSWL